ncbi:MAG: hypothetical protein NZ700_13865 [Gemmataceae bacterium]|nr:hypothetical protein [Gemmataceae bacterium]MDW8267228.1 EutN/CcmL family microcompartment protein [Gemmataceae bacterium]
MRIAEVIGVVTLSRVHPSVRGARWIIGVPFSRSGLAAGRPDGEDIVLLDVLGAGVGQRVGFTEGAEAAAPFTPAKKPVDAYAGCILDRIYLHDDRASSTEDGR